MLFIRQSTDFRFRLGLLYTEEYFWWMETTQQLSTPKAIWGPLTNPTTNRSSDSAFPTPEHLNETIIVVICDNLGRPYAITNRKTYYSKM